MASKQDIRAGRAYVELYVKNSALVKGLQSASKQFKSFGAGVAKLGGLMTAAGGAVLAPLAGMVKGFANAGSQLADMSARTGVSTEELSALGYAAGMTGSNLEDVERAIRFLQKSGGSVDSLGQIADQMAAMMDPAERTAFAIETFGKSGAALIPMLSGGSVGLAQFRAEAQKLGRIMSTEDAQAADALGDAMDRVKASLGGVAIQIGAALAPTATKLADTLTDIIGPLIQWVRENRQLVVTVATVAAGVAIAGTALAGLGGAISLAGFALGGLATALTAAAAVLGAIISPIGLVVAGLGLAGAAFFKFTTAGQQLAGWLGQQFRGLLDEVRSVTGGIADAFAGGDLILAGQIAWTGIQLAFYSARDAILAGYEDLKAAGLVAWTTIKMEFVRAVNFVSEIWDSLGAGLTSVFDRVIVGIRTAWSSVVSWIAKQILKLWGVIEPVLKSLSLISSTTDVGGAIRAVEAGNQEFAARLDRERQQRDQQRGADLAAVAGKRSAALEAATKEQAAAMSAFGAGAAGESPEVRKAREELARLTAEAATKAAEVKGGGAGTPPGEIPTGGAAGGTVATFSSAALQALGQGGPMQRLTKEISDHKKVSERSLAVLEEQVMQTQRYANLLTKLLTISS